MASLPALPALPALASLRRKNDNNVSAPELAGPVDAKLRLARRLQAEDDARRGSSVAPPPSRRRA